MPSFEPQDAQVPQIVARHSARPIARVPVRNVSSARLKGLRGTSRRFPREIGELTIVCYQTPRGLSRRRERRTPAFPADTPNAPIMPSPGKLFFGTILLALVSVFPAITRAEVGIHIGISLPLPPPIVFPPPPVAIVIPASGRSGKSRSEAEPRHERRVSFMIEGGASHFQSECPYRHPHFCPLPVFPR